MTQGRLSRKELERLEAAAAHHAMRVAEELRTAWAERDAARIEARAWRALAIGAGVPADAR